jgi:hypothetical protein
MQRTLSSDLDGTLAEREVANGGREIFRRRSDAVDTVRRLSLTPAERLVLEDSSAVIVAGRADGSCVVARVDDAFMAMLVE